jgi:very-short-patch-repair endonuclease
LSPQASSPVQPSPLLGEGGARAAGVGGRGGLLRDRARSLRRAQTDAETALWRLLRAKRFAGWKFRRQLPIGNYIVDFACPSVRLIVEADGSQHAESVYDVDRDGWLKTEGWRVLRFWNNEILENGEGVAEAILAALETPLPPKPAVWAPPSPTRGEDLQDVTA